MNNIHGCIFLMLVCLSFACCAPSYADASNSGAGGANHQNALLGNDGDANENAEDTAKDYDKRMERYAFGLGRRAYMYTNGGAGMKRLPVYNFGLGKRSRPYSFGLGKRDYDDEHEYDNNDYNRYNGGTNGAVAAYMADEKRNRPYSFGLGKRDSDDVDRRGYPNRYGFGLGRR